MNDERVGPGAVRLLGLARFAVEGLEALEARSR
jgi:hypothetical protein